MLWEYSPTGELAFDQPIAKFTIESLKGHVSHTQSNPMDLDRRHSQKHSRFLKNKLKKKITFQAKGPKLGNDINGK